MKGGRSGLKILVKAKVELARGIIGMCGEVGSLQLQIKQDGIFKAMDIKRVWGKLTKS